MEVRYLAHAKQTDGAGAHPADRRRVRRSASAATAGGLVRGYRIEDAETIVVALGSVLGTLKDTVDDMRDDGHQDRRAGHPARSARSRWPRCARRCRAPSAWWCWKRASRSAWAAWSPPTCAWRCRACSCTATPWSPGWAGAPSPRPRCTRMLREAIADTLQPLTFLDLDWRIVNRQLEREAADAPQRPDRRKPAARRRRRGRRR